ncbi:lethal (3) 04053 isoform X2 [Arctopsyche grandis]|uniref:lethal (3) 04053 isoform X2 n=1 Tax=Arctopsyche grandis TaxID=121162 RepID=UPI00406D8185
MAQEDEAGPSGTLAPTPTPMALQPPQPPQHPPPPQTLPTAEPPPPAPALTPAAPVNDFDTSKTTQSRKEESPFSFKHFLKRDLSLPTTSSSYESTGAKPKIYANTVHPSPAKANLHQEFRKDAKMSSRESWAGPSNASSDSSIELILNTNTATESKKILEIDNCDLSFRRSHTSSDVLGMPSLPDFVQDHLLVEQAYLGSNGPFTVDFDNLPDFTLSSNTNYDNAQSSHDKSDDLNYNANASKIGSCRSVPLDLPSFVEDRLEAGERVERRCRPSPLDLPNNLSLDLTDSLNHTNHRNSNQRLPFPLDLPRNENSTAGESLRLPDFLPTQVGSSNTGPIGIIPSNRDELAEERRRRTAAERELRSALQTSTQLRRELKAAKNAEQNARRELLEARTANAILAHQLKSRTNRTGVAGPSTSSMSASHSPNLSEEEKFASARVSQLKEDLAAARREIEELRGIRRGASESLYLAANTAENSLRELLSGLEQLRGLASSLNPP